MHKIRLYVVQEQEEAPDEEDFDEPDHPPPMMQRRNSRRPGAVRVNVIQKDRKVDSISPKLKQIRQEMNKCDVNSLEKTLSLSNRRGNLVRIESGVKAGKPKIPPPLPIRHSTLVPRKTVFASPRIKQLALNLQEKMIERSAKIQGENIANGNVQMSNKNLQVENKNIKMGNENIKLGNEHVGVGNENIWIGNGNLQNMKDENIKFGVRRLINRNENFLRGLTPIIENLNANGEVDEIKKVEMQKNGNPWISKRVCEYDELEEGHEMENNIDERFDARLPKIVRIKCDVTQGDMIQDDDCIKISDEETTTGSMILRRNNKLNRYKEYDLEQKIEVEIKMREGSARLLAAARHRAQSLEAARALLTSNERMSAYMAELQRRKKEPSNKTSLPASTARVSLSDLRVPLMWRDSDHFKNRGDYRRFAVFCLARVGTEIHDTALLCPVDRALTDISFPDVLVFNNVPAEFDLTLEIYSHILQEDLSIASTPRRIKRTIHSSISKTVGKKLAASLRDELNSGKIGPHFELMASARLTLDDTDDNIHTHDLVINNLENKHHALPLFGHFCCRLAAQPDCMSKEICTGNINLNGRNCWARLQGFEIRTWESRKLAEEDQSPAHTIPINRETFIQPSKSSRELRIVNNVDGTEKTTTIRLDSSEDSQRWLRQLNTHAKDHLRWKHAAESIQDVPCVESARNSFISNKRQGSLYDETPLIESVQLDYASSRPTVQEIFGLTPSTSLSSCSSSNSPPSLRSRSMSTSGPRKLSASALKSHWPFSNKNHD